MSDRLLDRHDVVLADLDGTVYRGGELVAGAAEAVDAAHRDGVAVRYVTNNASKPPEAVSDHLIGLGLPADPGEVSTSAQAGAALLAEILPAGARVLVVGTDALMSEVDKAGLIAVRAFADGPEAVVQGHSPETTWANLAEACLALRNGAAWVACNADATLPTERGELPGNGSMVAALREATGRQPQVAGKPQRPLLERAISSANAQRPLMVGDRLDTDIAGAVALGIPSLMVLTGVNTAKDLLFAPAASRASFVAADLTALCQDAAESAITEQEAWKVRVDETARVDETVLSLSATANGAEPLSALRALCAAWWVADSGPVEVRAEDSLAAAALQQLRLV